ncbi:MAG: eukaryotic-like serine/threonine-protein kinase [Actinomycetota bacterium]|nr:eukaryotic-like serine/threonine-protein kinase [Actinomycetota bacterium]
MRTLRPAVLLLAAALGAGVLAGCSSGSDNPTIQGSPTPTASASGAATATATPAPAVTTPPPAAPSPTVSRSPSAIPTKGAVGAYATLQSAETYAQSKSDQAGGTFDFIGADSTWRSSATLHVLHAMPAAAAGNGGDFFFFFVNGNPVGDFHFTGAVGERAPDATSFAVTYGVYKPGDAHCCPSGGNATVTFRWDGSKLVHDPAPGATLN